MNSQLGARLAVANGGRVPHSNRESEAIHDNREAGEKRHPTIDDLDSPDPEHGYRDPTYPHHSAATPPGCTTRCIACAEQFRSASSSSSAFTTRRYDHMYTDEKARDEILQLKNTTDQNLDRVRTLLDKHGDVMAKLWLKKTDVQRRSIAQNAMPDMYPHRGFPLDEAHAVHRPTPGGTISDTMKDRRLANLRTSMEKYRKSLLVPYLDLDSLSQNPGELLAVLCRRTESPPSLWALFDNSQITFHFRERLIGTSYNPHCVVMHGRRYGQLVSWDEKTAHRMDIIGFPKALLVFEAQMVISNFLLKVSTTLAQQTNHPGSSGRAQLDILAAPGFTTDQSWIAQYDLHSLHCFKPSTLDWNEVIETLTSRLHSAEDQNWLFQTDPAFLRQSISQFEGAAVHGHLSSEDIRKCRLELVMRPSNRLHRWKNIVGEVERMLVVSKGAEGTITPGNPLPRLYETALSCLEDFLTVEYSTQCGHLYLACWMSKAFKWYFKRDQPLRAEEIFHQDRLFFHLVQLQHHGKRPGRMLSLHLRMLDHIIATSHEQAARIDPLIESMLHDVSAVAGILVRVHLQRPRNRLVDEICVEMAGLSGKKRQDERVIKAEAHVKKFDLDWARGVMAQEGADVALVMKLHGPLETFLQLPRLSTKTTRDALSSFDQTHASLQAFWQEVSSVREVSLRGLRRTTVLPAQEDDEAFFAARLKLLTAWDDPTHLHGVAMERAALLAKIEARETRAAAARVQQENLPPALGVRQTVWGKASEDRLSLPREVKAKEKTRPEVSPAEPAPRLPVAAAAANPPAPPIRTIEVRPSTRSVFRIMYDDGAGATEELPERVDWSDFTAAMVDAGFSVGPCGGSVFTFKQMQGGGRINFHRPHPHPSMDHVLLRTMGKRLQKWFGFERETFVVRGEEEEGVE